MRKSSLLLLALAGMLLMTTGTDCLAVTPSFRRDCEVLTSTGHRLSGTPEMAKAGEHVLGRLREIGPDELIEQTFPTTQTKILRCEIKLEGEAVARPMLPMRPNGIIPPVTPPDGVTGRIVHVGAAQVEDFSRTSVKGAIVVADYNTGERWLRAFRLGAKAIVFTRRGTMEARHPHYVESSANLPRYFYEGSPADLVEGKVGTIQCEVIWKEGEGRNLIAFFRGTKPVFSQEKDEVIILGTNLDSFGEIPRLTPGARGAANCAGLLKIAEYVKTHRPRRHVLMVFFDNQARAHAGASAFYRAIEDEKEDYTVEARQKSWEAEILFLNKLASLVHSDSPLTAQTHMRRKLEYIEAVEDEPEDFLAGTTLEDVAVQVREEVVTDFVGKVEDSLKELEDWRSECSDALATQAASTSSSHKGLADLRRAFQKVVEEAEVLWREQQTVVTTLQSSGKADLGANKKKTVRDFEMLRLAVQTDYETEMEDIRKVRRQLLGRLADKAKERAEEINDQIYRFRDEELQIEKKYRLLGQDIPAEEQERIDEMVGEKGIVETQLKPVKDDWNELQRTIGRQKRQFGSGDGKLGLKTGVQEKLDLVLGEVEEDIAARRKELEGEGRQLVADAALKALIGNAWISLHASLLLGDTCDRWGLVIGGESALHSSQDNPGLYGKIQSVFLKADKILGGADSRFLEQSANQDLPQTRVLWGAPFLVHSGEVAGLFGIYNLALGTVQEGLVREGTPDDTIANLNLDYIETQVDEIALFLAGPADVPLEGEGSVLAALEETASLSAMAAEAGDKEERKTFEDKIDAVHAAHTVLDSVGNQEGLSLRRGIVAGKEYIVPMFEDDSVHGPMVMGLLPGSSIPNTPMGGAIVQFRLRASYTLAYNTNKPFGFDNFQILRTTRNGVYQMGPVSGGWVWRVRGGFAAIFDERGAITQVSDTESYTKIRWRLNVFRCNSGMATLPPQLRTDRLPGEEVKILSARANADLDKKKSFTETADGIVVWYSEERERGVKLFSLRQMVGLHNGPETFGGEKEVLNPNGDGFSMQGESPTINVPARSSSDLWRLNESRLAILRSKGIQDSSLAELHGRSEDLLIETRDEKSPLRREALATSSFWASQPVYRKVRSMLDDLVRAVLILLALSVPFSFAIERVVVGATTIYRQLCWFMGFFALTFLILYLSHPAFAIANTPIIIFLGFAILMMSVMVIVIIMRKFEFELKALQGMTATVHASDVSSVSTFMAAMHMGISTMRRRPMRTALTAITIILLTFTILCFASFGTQYGIIPLFSAPNPSYSGIFVHNVNWNPLSPDLSDVIKGRWRDRVSVCRRFWISPKTQDNPGLLVSRSDGSSPVTIKGVLGLDPHEFKSRPDLVELFGEIDDDTVLLTSAVAAEGALNVKPGDEVVLKGRRLRVGRLLDSVKVSASKDMDASSILPADFTEATSTQQTAEAEEDAELMTQRNWASLPVDSVAIVSARTARELGASLYGILLYTKDSTEAIEIAEDLSRMLPFPIAATRDNGVYRHILGTVLKASGAKDLFFPIVLGGLVIFGTMLGSVADRQKEIYTFSALGLAPKHVATLFFAEAMVYSLIGGLGGYLLAQGTMKILGLLSEYGLVRVPEMNMSSTNTIVTILIVMATVLISAIYPAIKASKSANPGLMRMWRPPPPDGDLLDLVFPFTVSEYDITGVVSFLREHFNNHTDTGLGRFMTSSVQLAKEANGNLGLDANVALAPFDLGVSQTFALRSTPSEIPGIDEVRVIMKRLSGQPKDWQRLNKVFLDDLRQQFLIWRSIPHETMELYRERTLTALGGGEAGTTDDDATASEDA